MLEYSLYLPDRRGRLERRVDQICADDAKAMAEAAHAAEDQAAGPWKGERLLEAFGPPEAGWRRVEGTAFSQSTPLSAYTPPGRRIR